MGGLLQNDSGINGDKYINIIGQNCINNEQKNLYNNCSQISNLNSSVTESTHTNINTTNHNMTIINQIIQNNQNSCISENTFSSKNIINNNNNQLLQDECLKININSTKISERNLKLNMNLNNHDN